MSLRPVFVLLLLAPATLAQLSEKQAIAQAKAAGKDLVAAFKAEGKTALGTLDATLDGVDAQLDDTSNVAGVSVAIANAAITFLTDVNDAWEDVINQFAGAESSALSDFADGAELEGVYPQDFYTGSGGLMDAHRRTAAKAATKLRDAANKRLAATAKLAEKLSGIALVVHVELPAVKVASAMNQSGFLKVGMGVRLDLVLAASALDTADDGYLIVGGVSGDDSTDVTVDWYRENPETDTLDVGPTPGTGRFTAVFAGLKEGNYVATARQSGLIPADVVEIGLR